MSDPVSLHDVSLSDFRRVFSGTPSIGFGDDMMIIDISFDKEHKFMFHPCRLDCVLIFYCIKGHVRLNVNLEEYDMKDNMLLLNMPGNLIRLNEVLFDGNENFHYVCLAMSKDFMNGLLPDVSKKFTQNILSQKNPCVTISVEERNLLAEHQHMISAVLKSEIPYREESVRSVLASLLYTLAGIWSAHVTDKKEVESRSSARNKVMLDQFMTLVSEYHSKYRNVGFYAERLSLTPKYLSRLIKEATGRSAPEWIDEYVILEAKNLLKNSSLAIKEIVARLNFPNQSVFYKFFKSHTGMTPTEYRHL